MAWISNGTVTVSNGSAAVTGIGTTWNIGVQRGWGFVGPDGRTYEVASINSDNSLTLARPFLGSSGSGQIYALFPTTSLAGDLAEQVSRLIANFTSASDVASRFESDTIPQFQAQVDAATANLRGVVNSQMHFTAVVDPDESAPTRIDGGTFNTIADAVAASPAASVCEVILQAGKSYDVGQDINMLGRNIFIRKAGAGADPIVNAQARASATHNSLYQFRPSGGGALSFFLCDVRLPTASPNPSLPWSASRSILIYVPGQVSSISMDRCRVSGGIPGVSLGLVSGLLASSASLSSFTSTFDGPFFGVIDGGATLINNHTLTLLNGAAVRDRGVIGVDTLER